MFICGVGGQDDYRQDYLSVKNDTHNFTIYYPPDFERIQVENSGVALALRHGERGFPTFNVVVAAGSYSSLSKTPGEIKRDIQRNYRLTGLRDVAVLEGYETSIADTGVFTVVLRYGDGESEYVSVVSLVDTYDRHFFLTTVHERAQVTEAKNIHNEIVSSFQGPVPLEMDERARGVLRRTPIFAVVLLAVALIIVLAIRSKRASSG